MAKKTSRSATRRSTSGRSRTGAGGSSRVAGRKSPAGGRGSTRTAGGRTRTGGGGTTRAAGGTKSRGGARTATTGRTRSATGAQKRTGGARTGGKTKRRAAGTARPTGQLSEQEKRRLAAQTGETNRPVGSARSQQQNQDRTREVREIASQSESEFQERHDQRNLSEEDLLYRTSDYRQQKRIEEDVFASTIQKANLWLKEVMDEIGTDDRHRAHTALKSVLQTLRDRLTVEEAVDVASQLPTIIRGIYFEGWKPSGKPIKYNKEEFISVVAGYFQSLSGINHGEIIRAIFTVLQRHIAEGEINHLIGTLPDEFAEFWLEEQPVNP